MTFGGRKAALLLFVGDIVVYTISLWLTLFLRYGELPSQSFFSAHILSFVPLFMLWSLVFFMSGLYSKRMLLSQGELTSTIIYTQLLNITLAALFFFVMPNLGIAPKTNLAIYLFVSLLLISVWRLFLVPRLSKPSYREAVALVGAGPDVDELVAEVNNNARYPFEFRVVVAPTEAAHDSKGFVDRLIRARVMFLVVEHNNTALQELWPHLYNLVVVERRCQYANLSQVYERVFDRIPLSTLDYAWCAENLSRPHGRAHALFKRVIDLVGGLMMGVVTVLLIPFIYIAMRLEGPGPLFIAQERFGQYGTRMRAYKFRSMTSNDAASQTWIHESQVNKITRVGAVLRKTSLDEFPQFLNVLRGELSLVGPRNDIWGLGMQLSEAIPYYHARYMVKPGITGWAQINQQYEAGHISPQSVRETKMRLAYDFYYIKNRSFMLDILIALRTVKRMLFRLSVW